MTEHPRNQLTYEQIRALPKVELHVHLDCCLSYDVVSKLKPGITKETYREQFIAPAKCKNLADFLSRIQSSIDLMQTDRGLRLVTKDLFKQLKRDNVIYAEIRFAPLQHLKQGLTPDKVVETVENATAEASKDTGVEARIILCTLRHFTPKQSLRMAKLLEDFRGTHVAGMDLAADEAGFPLSRHVEAFNYIMHRFIPCTAHAGEAKGPKSVRETLEKLHPTRIGHGVRSIEDPELVRELIDKNILLEICPSCNIQTDVYDTYKNHPVDALYRAGVPVCINTDARTTTNITLSKEYQRLQKTFGWGAQDFLTSNLNALDAAFLADCKKEQLKQRILKYGAAE